MVVPVSVDQPHWVISFGLVQHGFVKQLMPASLPESVA